MIAATDRLAGFIDRMARSAAPSGPLSEIAQRIAQSALVGASAEARPRRKSSVCADGTPLLFSWKARTDGGGSSVPARGFRLHAEPGALSLSVSEQVDLSLWTLSQLFARLGWRHAPTAVNNLVGRLLPHDPLEVDRWWGGLGLGCAAESDAIELRLYVNVREGDRRACWSRMGLALADMWGLPAATRMIERLVGQLEGVALPVGIAAAIRDDALVGLRFYFSLNEPGREAILDAGQFSSAGARRIADFCAAYPECRPYSYGCVTLAFDFGPIPTPAPVRVKADFDCTPAAGLPCSDPAYMRDWLIGRHADDALDAQGLLALMDAVETDFGGCVVDYVSVGDAATRELTTYILPAGFAAPNAPFQTG